MHDETVPAGCPRNYPVVPTPPSQRNHTLVAAHPNRTGSHAGPEGKASISQRNHGIGSSHPATYPTGRGLPAEPRSQ